MPAVGGGSTEIGTVCGERRKGSWNLYHFTLVIVEIDDRREVI